MFFHPHLRQAQQEVPFSPHLSPPSSSPPPLPAPPPPPPSPLLPLLVIPSSFLGFALPGDPGPLVLSCSRHGAVPKQWSTSGLKVLLSLECAGSDRVSGIRGPSGARGAPGSGIRDPGSVRGPAGSPDRGSGIRLGARGAPRPGIREPPPSSPSPQPLSVKPGCPPRAVKDERRRRRRRRRRPSWRPSWATLEP